MSQRTAGSNWLIYTADTGAVLTVDQVETDRSAIWWLSGIARGEICTLLEQDLRQCSGRLDLILLVLKDVSDISSECLIAFVRLQKEVLDLRNSELRLAVAKGAMADKLQQLRIDQVLNVTAEIPEQPKTGRPPLPVPSPKPPLPPIPKDYPVAKSAPWLILSCRDGSIFPATETEIVIGRSPECGIRLTMPSISRKHAKIFQQDGNWWVQDLGSSFGTWLDDKQLEPMKPVALKRHTAALRLSRFFYELVMPPFSALINPDDCGAGPTGRLVHLETGEFLSMPGRLLMLGRKYAPADSGVLHARVISSRHAQICREADGFYLTDLNSTNGTYLNDVPLLPQTPMLLTDGAQIRLGSKERGEVFRWVEGKGEMPDEA